MSTVAGTCLCGTVALRVSAPIRRVVNCHCQMCRSMNGAAFSTYAVVNDADLAVTRGADAIAVHPATPTARKHWCARCGTPLYNTNTKYAGLAMLYLGILEGGAALQPDVNIYCSSKLPWVDQIHAAASLDDGPRRSG